MRFPLLVFTLSSLAEAALRSGRKNREKIAKNRATLALRSCYARARATDLKKTREISIFCIFRFSFRAFSIFRDFRSKFRTCTALQKRNRERFSKGPYISRASERERTSRCILRPSYALSLRCAGRAAFFFSRGFSLPLALARASRIAKNTGVARLNSRKICSDEAVARRSLPARRLQRG